MKKVFCLVLILLAVSIACNIWLWNKEPQINTIVETKTDTLWRDTTIYKPQPTDSTQTGKIVYINVPTPADTIRDSILVELPVEQKRYDDSLYTAWVSGYKPALDSISLHQPTIINEKTITNTIYKEPLVTVGLQGGVGYGLISGKADVYIGIGGTLRLLWRSKKRKQ